MVIYFIEYEYQCMDNASPNNKMKVNIIALKESPKYTLKDK